MSTFTVNVPEPVMATLVETAKKHGFGDVSDYVSQLVVKMSARQTEIEQLAIEGIESSPSEPWNPSELDEIRRDLKSRFKS